MYLRSEGAMTQSALALRMHVSQPSISDWLNGHKRPSDANRELLRRFCGIPTTFWNTDAEALTIYRGACVRAIRRQTTEQRESA